MTPEEAHAIDGPDEKAGEMNLTDARVCAPMKQPPEHGGMSLDNMRVGAPVEVNVSTNRTPLQDLPDAAIATEVVRANLNTLSETLEEGVAGLDEAARRELAECVRKVLRGEAYLSPDLARRLIRLLDPLTDAEPQAAIPAVEPPAEPLTPRQLEVLKLLAQGQTNPDIARELVLSTGTVRTHVQRIMARLGVSDRTGAVVRAIELGLITPKSSI